MLIKRVYEYSPFLPSTCSRHAESPSQVVVYVLELRDKTLLALEGLGLLAPLEVPLLYFSALP